MERKQSDASDRQAGASPWRRAEQGAKATHLIAFFRRRNLRDQEYQ